MYYPEEFIKQINGIRVVEVIGKYIHLSRYQGAWLGQCPFHDDTSRTLVVDEEKNIWYCLGCGKSGNAISFMMYYFDLSFQSAVYRLADLFLIEIPEEVYVSERERQSKKERLYQVNKAAALFFYRELRSDRGAEGLRYFENRGIARETMHRFGLGYTGKKGIALTEHLRSIGFSDKEIIDAGLCCRDDKGKVYDRFRDRVMFPIVDRDNRVIAFGGRLLHGRKNKSGKTLPKYLNTPDTPIFDKSSNMYGIIGAQQCRSNVLIICEGYMDVIAMHQAGFTNAVASLGTALTDRHCNIVKELCNKVVLSYDSDDAGQKATARAIPMLEERNIEIYMLNLIPYKDPDEAIQKAGKDFFADRVWNATPQEVVEAQKDISNEKGISEICHMISQSPEAVQYQKLKSVAWKFGLNAVEVQKRVNLFNAEKIVSRTM